ncbi:MAG: hypothetical protein MUO40_05680 [Anaerolineaceae bacterium]|nr:hypothetical protein [Anaerolineaceae bacterium]
MFNSPTQIFVITTGVILGIGILCLILRIIILVKQTMGKNIQSIADQTTKLAEKGITDNISGLVGNASSLISSLNDLARSNTGVGIFLVFLSIALLAGAYFLARQLGFTLQLP